jgi:hypothetical protein
MAPLPRASLERVRTLEFAFDDEPVQEHTATPVAVEEPLDLTWASASPRRRGRNLLIAAGVVGSAVAALLWSQRGAWAGTAESAAAASATAPAAAEPASELPPSTEVHVQLNNLPAQAIVSVDGIPVGANPLELPRDGRNRVIKVVAPGKAPWQAVHHASGDATYEVWMVDSAEPAPAAVKKSAAVAKSTAARPRVHKKPPSALRKLDF